MYSHLEKSAGEETENIYNWILTTEGTKVTDFHAVPNETQLLVLANSLRSNLIQKLINYKKKEQK